MKKSFEIRPVQKFSGSRTPKYRSTEIGYFSIDGSRNFYDDNSQLKYYVEPTTEYLNLDLRQGFTTSIGNDFSAEERLKHFLTWIDKHNYER